MYRFCASAFYPILIILVSCGTNRNNEDSSKHNREVSSYTSSKSSKEITSADPLNGWEFISENEVDTHPVKPKFTKRAFSKIIWQKISRGTEYAEIDAPIQCNIGDSKIRIVRINPNVANLKLISSKEQKLTNLLTAEQYSDRFDLSAAINTSMFGMEGRSVGYMKSFAYINNGHLGKDKTIIAFNPKSTKWPAFKIIDLSCEDWEVWKDRYQSFIQNIRMIGCDGKVKWSKQEKFWSTACIAEDKNGNCLFIHARSPYRVHDLANMLLQLPLGIQRCCYAEGGPESSLHVQLQDTTIRSFGSYETDFMESDDNHTYWELPNILGVAKDYK